MMSTVLEYFPGANTPYGFFSYYHNILTPKDYNRMYIIKGGPGTGKSTFMKQLAYHAQNRGYDTEMLHCSSDPDSLDGVVIRQSGIAVIDGTSPHVCDPIVPGAFDEILNFGDFFDTAKLARDKEIIINLQSEISAYFTNAYSYLAAANSLIEKQKREVNSIINQTAIDAVLSDILNDIDLSGSYGSGNPKNFFLSGITPLGFIHYCQNFANIADKVYVLKNNIGADSSALFNRLSDRMHKKNIDGYIFHCPISPKNKIEHIYIPDANIFITTSNKFHNVSGPKFNVYDIDLISNCKQLDYRDDEKILNSIFERAINCIKTAKATHDILEKSYISAMNFDALNEYSKNLIELIIK